MKLCSEYFYLSHFTTIPILAEQVAQKFGISRFEQDQFATESQNKAETAKAQNLFNNEIVPVFIKKSNSNFLDDEFPRKGTTMEKLQKLKPCFITDDVSQFTVTACLKVTLPFCRQEL